MHAPRVNRANQRGLAALAFVAVLLFAMSLALLWSGRGLVFTQRAAANQTRQAVAVAAAESGLAWAEARLNDARAIDEACVALNAGRGFRDRYAAPWVASASDRGHHEAESGFEPPPGLRALCRIDADALSCHCPGTAVDERHHAGLDANDGPRFSIEFTAVDREARSLWVVSRGCSGAWSACTAASATEGQAVVRAQLRLVATEADTDPATALRQAPLAIVAGSWRDGRCLGASPTGACRFEP